MSTPGTYDFSVVRGSVANERFFSPLVLRFILDDVPMAFEDVRLSVYARKDDELRGDFLFRAVLGDGIEISDEYASEVMWLATAAQTRLLLVGAKNYYEVEFRRDGNEAIYLRGTITGIGGLNDDADVGS